MTSTTTVGADIDYWLVDDVYTQDGYTVATVLYPSTAAIPPTGHEGWNPILDRKAAISITGYRGTMRVNVMTSNRNNL